MSLTFAMILGGSLLVYAGWKNLSLADLARGDNTVVKPAVRAGAAA